VRADLDPAAAVGDRAAALDLLVNACLRLRIIDRMLRSRVDHERFLFAVELILETYYDIEARNDLHGVFAYCGPHDLLKIDYASIDAFRDELEQRRRKA